jgi:hypothetical protein
VNWSIVKEHQTLFIPAHFLPCPTASLGGSATNRAPAFASAITLSKAEVFDVVARCDEVVGHAAAWGDLSVAFGVDSIRQFLLGRLMGDPGGLDGGPGDDAEPGDR